MRTQKSQSKRLVGWDTTDEDNDDDDDDDNIPIKIGFTFLPQPQVQDVHWQRWATEPHKPIVEFKDEENPVKTDPL